MKRHLDLMAAFAVGILLMLFCVFFQDLTTVAGPRQWCLVLSNAALIPGTLLASLGVLLLVSGEGFFDGLKYAVTSTFDRLRSVKPKYGSYYEYSKRPRSKVSAGFLLIPGGIFLALAVILTALFYLLP